MRSRSEPPVGGPLVVVLGASGFVGAAVAAELAASSTRLRLIVHQRQLPALPGSGNVEVRSVDLTQAQGVRKAVADADMIVHLAAGIGGAASWRTAGNESERLSAGLVSTVADAVPASASRPPVFVLASTVQLSSELSSGRTPNEYVRHKAAAERVVHEATADGSVRGFAIRLPTVYGGNPLTGSVGRGVVAAMARKAIAGEPITMWHDGSVCRDLLHVTDAGRAFAASLEHSDQLAGGCWTVGTGRDSRLGDVFRLLARLVAARTGKPAVPVVTVPAPDWADPGDFDDMPADPSAFSAATGWMPTVQLTQGLHTVVASVLASA